MANKEVKVWGIVNTGEVKDVVITEATRTARGIELMVEAGNIVFQWSVGDTILFKALVLPALDAGYTGNASDYQSLTTWLKNRIFTLYHVDTEKPGPYRHRYYINEFTGIRESEAK